MKKLIPLIVITILTVGLFGWWMGNKRSPAPAPSAQTNTTQTSTSTSSSGNDVKSLVTYTLPDGWKEASCPASPGSVYIAPNGAGSVDCSANPSSPVKMSVDPGSSKDCNDIQNVQNVKKHICSSLYINGHKTLKASTEYLSASSYGKDTTVNAYYLDSDKGVIKIEYVFNSNGQFQAAFDQLANSVQTK